MAGNISDKAKYALREYDVRRGGGCDWYVTGVDGVEHKLQSCVYDQWGANPPSKVVRVLKEAVSAAGIRPKSYVAPPTALETYEGTLYDKGEVETAKERYEETKPETLPLKPETLIGLPLMVLGFIAAAWFLLMGRR